MSSLLTRLRAKLFGERRVTVCFKCVHRGQQLPHSEWDHWCLAPGSRGLVSGNPTECSRTNAGNCRAFEEK